MNCTHIIVNNWHSSKITFAISLANGALLQQVRQCTTSSRPECQTDNRTEADTFENGSLPNRIHTRPVRLVHVQHTGMSSIDTGACTDNPTCTRSFCMVISAVHVLKWRMNCTHTRTVCTLRESGVFDGKTRPAAAGSDAVTYPREQ